MPYLQKFSEKSFRALSSWNHTQEGVGSEEEDAPGRREFWDRVDFCLGAMMQLTKRKREGERETCKKAPNTSIYKNIKK